MHKPTRLMVTPELTHPMLRANRRHNQGITSTLEPAIEQMEAIHLANPIPHGAELINALKAYNKDDDTKLNQFMFGTNHYPFPRTQ